MVLSSEQRILDAAKKIFHRKGFDGARMQEIADEAGLNKALVHYYFRNKDNLFQSVFEDAFSRLLSKLNEIFFSEGTLQYKIETFLHYYLDFLSENSYLPMFILNGIYNKPEQLKAFLERKALSPEKILTRIKQQLREELNLDIDPMHVYINILSLVVFPIVARPLIQGIFGYTPEKMTAFYEERKREVPMFVINALKGYTHEATATKV